MKSDEDFLIREFFPVVLEKCGSPETIVVSLQVITRPRFEYWEELKKLLTFKYQRKPFLASAISLPVLALCFVLRQEQCLFNTETGWRKWGGWTKLPLLPLLKRLQYTVFDFILSQQGQKCTNTFRWNSHLERSLKNTEFGLILLSGGELFQAFEAVLSGLTSDSLIWQPQWDNKRKLFDSVQIVRNLPARPPPAE